MDKYAQLKKFRRERRPQVYMYALKHIDPETIPVEDYFPDTKQILITAWNLNSSPIPKTLTCT